MGGDHKCPVCQATFTRPQHVARHMRSHTGDRPYKCQYCGDQFARSDLLARHINKCHANEKPLPNTASNTRRKGSAATSRATTSKQACDQCVQSSLPCDGSNPCSKCVSRKCHCTYVKFHRQTAPSGPGHHPPRSPSSSSSSLNGSIAPSRLPPRLDSFAIPTSMPPVSTPFSGSEQIFNTPFTFTPGVPAYPQNWTTADMVQLPFSMAPDADMTAKYRAQFDSLRRASPSVVSSSSAVMLPNMYAAQQSQPPSSTGYPAWGESGAYPPLDDFDGLERTHSLASSEPTSFTPEFYGVGFIGSAYRPRRVSLDLSDSSSATSQSVPSSATSSNVHLPLSGNEMYDARPEETQGQPHDAHIMHHQRNNSLPGSQSSSFSALSEHPQPQQPHRVGEGGFSSAFGLMSIDDPNVLAGLSSDGVPFFSNLGVGVLPHSPNATPMPTRMQHSQPQPGRDRGMSTPGSTKEIMDSRELRDMWKTYLRSPLGGSGTATLDAASFGQMPPQSPSSGQRRRVRVSSLPSVTPTMERGQSTAMNTHGDVSAAGAGMSRSTLHGNPDDLRSYEAAVNARSASLKLNLVPRRKGTRPNTSEGPPMDAVVAGGTDPHAISRPSSASSGSQPFTTANHHHHAHAGVVKPPPMQGASISLPVPPTMSMSGLHAHGHGHAHAHSHSVTTFGSGGSSRASSVASDGTGTGGSGSDGEMLRPSFKRYPSQTLGPASSKRALVERGGGESKGVSRVVDKAGLLKVEDRGERRGGEERMSGRFERAGKGVGGSPGSRPIAALPERAKRG